MQTLQLLAHLYEHYSEAPVGCFGSLDDSLHPRGPSFLFDLTDDLGLHPSSTILGFGCGQGHYAVALATRHGCYVVAIDPVDHVPMPHVSWLKRA
jgi:cyclopropane fatty-acyl-phospholipid synthase-like methyltransferase